ncbi:Protein FAR1-RELATED SEQUENCE 5 [Linum perenne]
MEVGKYGGHAHVGYTKLDAFNQYSRQEAERIAEGDAATALAYLKSKTKQDPNFFMEYTLNEENMLEKVFWADSMSIADFACFGEILEFDATYKKIKYNLPLVIFSGINQHFRTCVFGCAFMQHEREENYRWVLNTLSKAMGGKKPGFVITDGDRAMSSAIKSEFPEATHRLCSWHLNNNVTQHVKNHKFRSEWTRFVKADYPSSEAWLADWNAFLEDCTLSDNTWINTNLTLKREDWADTYFRKKFFAGMRTTSRCEGLNSQLGKKVKNGANLKVLDFFVSFDRWMTELREEELRLDYQSIHSTPEIQSKALKSLEESAAAVYSLKAFLKFRDELECSTGCIKEGKEIDGGCHTYTVSMFGAEDISWKVTYDDTKNTVHCSCDKFIRMGIPCPHMLFVLKEESKLQIPSSFVKHCWTKTPKEYANMPQPTHVDEAQQIRLRHGILTYTAVEFFQRGVLSAESCKVAQEVLKTTIENLRNMDQGPIQTPQVIVPEELKGIKDPKNVAFKGSAGKKGKKAIKQRKCGYCKKLGHYQTNCSQKLAEETEAARAGTGDLQDVREDTE